MFINKLSAQEGVVNSDQSQEEDFSPEKAAESAEKKQTLEELLAIPFNQIKEEQEEIEEIMGYPQDSAGSMMATDIFTLYQDITCGDALSTLQDQQDAEMVFYLYITDEDNSLVGVASLRALATTPSNTLLKDIMERRVHSVRPETDQEDVAQIVAQYNYLAVQIFYL